MITFKELQFIFLRFSSSDDLLLVLADERIDRRYFAEFEGGNHF